MSIVTFGEMHLYTYLCLLSGLFRRRAAASIIQCGADEWYHAPVQSACSVDRKAYSQLLVGLASVQALMKSPPQSYLQVVTSSSDLTWGAKHRPLVCRGSWVRCEQGGVARTSCRSLAAS